MLLDQYGNVREILHYSEGLDEATIEAREDVQPVLDANRAAQADGAGWSPSREMRHVARIPQILWAEWERLYGVGFHKDRGLLRRLLNDPDNRNLRVSLGGF